MYMQIFQTITSMASNFVAIYVTGFATGKGVLDKYNFLAIYSFDFY